MVNKYFVPLLFNESIRSKFSPWTNVWIFFLHNIAKSFQVFFKKVKNVKVWWKQSFFEPIVKKFWLACLGSTDQRYNYAINWRIILFIVLVIVKCTQLHYTKVPPKQLFRHKFLKMNSPKTTEDNQQNHKKLGQKHKDLEHGCPKQAHEFLSWLLSSKTILPGN